MIRFSRYKSKTKLNVYYDYRHVILHSRVQFKPFPFSSTTPSFQEFPGLTMSDITTTTCISFQFCVDSCAVLGRVSAKANSVDDWRAIHVSRNVLRIAFGIIRSLNQLVTSVTQCQKDPEKRSDSFCLLKRHDKEQHDRESEDFHGERRNLKRRWMFRCCVWLLGGCAIT
jgi:hypothetical protein